MKIAWSPLALERVEEYADYIALDNPAAAVEWAEQVFAKVEPLAEFPELGRIVPELGKPDVREVIHGNYRIIYRVSGFVSVLTIRHGAQLLSEADLEEDH